VVISVSAFTEDIPAMVSFSSLKRTEGLELKNGIGEAVTIYQGANGQWMTSQGKTKKVLNFLTVRQAVMSESMISNTEAVRGENFVNNTVISEGKPAIVPQYPALSFEEEVQRGAYISGRVEDLTREDTELVRRAVPIKVDDKVVGILYGVITLDKIETKYNSMAAELDAQLFVYDNKTGKFIIDTIEKTPGELKALKTRKYNDGSSYEQLEKGENGYFYACGPEPMLKALCKATEIPGELSFEERMGCGFGACMGCSCKTLTGNKRICKEGPVMKKEEILW
jgi:hypothetical protein